MSVVAYSSRRVVLPDGVVPATVLVDTESGRIVSVSDYANCGDADTVYEVGEHALLPGLIDPHVHINDPGRTHWETFRTATRAAAAGGITTLIDMPLNCLPETTTVGALELKRQAAAGETYVDWRPWGGAVGKACGGADNCVHLLPLAKAGVPGFKCFLIYPGCDGLGAIDEATLRAAMPLIAGARLPLLVHAELAGPLDHAAALLDAEGADWMEYATYLASRPDKAEVDAVALMVRLCREFGTRVHIVHVSSAECLPLIRAAKAEGLPLTAETCPHYLYFAAETIADRSTLHKCAPPIRSRANRELLWQGLEDGTLDLIASDHSPCPVEMKGLADGNFRTAWGGIAGLSLTLPVVWTAMQQRGLPLARLAEWMSAAPARLAGLADSQRDALLRVTMQTWWCLRRKRPSSPCRSSCTICIRFRRTLVSGLPAWCIKPFCGGFQCFVTERLWSRRGDLRRAHDDEGRGRVRACTVRSHRGLYRRAGNDHAAVSFAGGA